jgi:hypothetical protein
MNAAIGLLVSGVLFAIAMLHVYWAFGGRTGMIFAVPSRDGEPLFRPSRASTLAVAFALLAAGAVALDAGHLLAWRLPRPVALVGCMALAVVFVARAVGERRYIGFFKQVRGTSFAWWDTRVFSPLCAAVGVAFVILAIGGW